MGGMRYLPPMPPSFLGISRPLLWSTPGHGKNGNVASRKVLWVKCQALRLHMAAFVFVGQFVNINFDFLY